jgi:nucleoside-diphosphate-sugar epimerase
MLNDYKDVFVIGGTGFTGTRIVKALIGADKNVFVLVRSIESANKIRALKAVPISGNLDGGDLEKFFDEVKEPKSTLFIYTASMGFGHIEEVLKYLELSQIKRAIFTSTSSIYTKLPVSSKPIRLKAEQAVMGSNLDWTIIRPTMIYGDTGDRNMERLIKVVNKLPIVLLPLVDKGQALQQPVHVDDLVNVILTAADTKKAVGKAYDIGGKDSMTLKILFEDVSHVTGKKLILVNLPSRYLAFLLRLYEKTTKKPKLKEEQIKRLAENKNVDISYAKNDLNYQPRSFFEGIKAEYEKIVSKG